MHPSSKQACTKLRELPAGCRCTRAGQREAAQAAHASVRDPVVVYQAPSSLTPCMLFALPSHCVPARRTHCNLRLDTVRLLHRDCFNSTATQKPRSPPQVGCAVCPYAAASSWPPNSGTAHSPQAVCFVQLSVHCHERLWPLRALLVQCPPFCSQLPSLLQLVCLGLRSSPEI